MNGFKKQRLAAQLTQEQVAEYMGIDQPAISNWENGYSLPRPERLPMLAILYNCTIEQLLTDPAE